MNEPIIANTNDDYDMTTATTPVDYTPVVTDYDVCDVNLDN